MAQPAQDDEFLTLEEAERHFGLKRSTLYRYVQKGQLSTYRRSGDRKAYVRRSDLEALRRLTLPRRTGRLSMEALERLFELQRREFGDRVLTTPSADLIEEGRRERDEELP